MKNIFTSYSAGINLKRKYRDIYEEAMTNTTFRANYVGDAEILN